MVENTNSTWGSRSKWLHWLMALMILVIVPAGYVMGYTYGAALESEAVLKLHDLMGQIHMTTDLFVLIFVAVRLSWRFKNPVPGLPASLETYQMWLARLTHGFLYALLFLMPLSGWAAMSVIGEFIDARPIEIWFFGWDIVPSILPTFPLDHMFGYQTFRSIHVYLLYAGAAILSLHILAAIWHHFVRKDHTLLRMWPAASFDKSKV